MASVTTAQDITLEISEMLAPNQGWKKQISVVFDGLTDPKFSHRLEKLTWSRVKTWFYGQARQVLWEEMRALEELRALEEARREQREFDAATHRLAIALASEGASFTRTQLAALERIKGRATAGSVVQLRPASPRGSRPSVAVRNMAASGARKAA
ncbi:MAG: hypothetical protein IKE42_15305 [Aquamicrobium sp.]|nr:hypothetical protein [Aquamicrobium sp.]